MLLLQQLLAEMPVGAPPPGDAGSYEEMLEYAERVGQVSTGLSVAQVARLPTRTVEDEPPEPDAPDAPRCCICCYGAHRHISTPYPARHPPAPPPLPPPPPPPHTHHTPHTQTTCSYTAPAPLLPPPTPQGHAKGDVILALPCGHDYHLECIAPWLRAKRICPLCKTPAVPPPPSG